MERRWIGGAAWAIGGLLVALALTFGAFALAGSDLSEPASTPILSISPSTPAGGDAGQGASQSPSAAPSPSETASPSAGLDDHGAGSDDGSSSDSGSGSSSNGEDHGDD